jgi:hypothetical protein
MTRNFRTKRRKRSKRRRKMLEHFKSQIEEGNEYLAYVRWVSVKNDDEPYIEAEIVSVKQEDLNTELEGFAFWKTLNDENRVPIFAPTDDKVFKDEG